MTAQQKKTPKKATVTRPRVTIDELKRFVEIYQAANSAVEVAEKTGWKIEKVRTQATRLRKNGVPLKKFTKKSALTTADLTSLKALCAENTE